MSTKFDPLTGELIPESNVKISHSEPSDAPDLSNLESMTKEELIGLIKRIGGAMWGIGLKSPEDIAEAFKLKLAIGGMAEKDMFKALPVMREWFDRTLGKASQSIAMTVEDKGISKLSDERLLRLERELSRITGEQSVVISPMPEKLNADN